MTYYLRNKFKEPKFKFAALPKEDPKLFLFQLEAHCDAYDFGEEEVRKLLPMVFEGRALVWYQQHGIQADTYLAFRELFKTRYLSPEDDAEKRLTLIQTKQARDEDLNSYIDRMVAMNQRLATPLREPDFLATVRANLQYDFAVALSPQVFRTLGDFEREATRLQQLRVTRQEARVEKGEAHAGTERENKQPTQINTKNNRPWTQKSYQTPRVFATTPFYVATPQHEMSTQMPTYSQPIPTTPYLTPMLNPHPLYFTPIMQNISPETPLVTSSFQKETAPDSGGQDTAVNVLTAMATTPAAVSRGLTMDPAYRPQQWTYGFPRPRNRSVMQNQLYGTSGRVFTNNNWPRARNPRSFSLCYYCSEPGHFQRECPYMQMGNEELGRTGADSSENRLVPQGWIPPPTNTAPSSQP